jgi:hypothetical protein
MFFVTRGTKINPTKLVLICHHLSIRATDDSNYLDCRCLRITDIYRNIYLDWG